MLVTLAQIALVCHVPHIRPFKDLVLRACPKKGPGFFDHEIRQRFDFERVLVDQMIPFYGDAL
jgi:hypothetical protein